MRWPWQPRRTAAERRLSTYADTFDARLAGVDRYTFAGAAMALDDLVAEGAKVASAYVLQGSTIENARHLAILDLSPVIREQQGWAVTKEFRERLNTLPVFLLLTPAAHIAAHNNHMAQLAAIRRAGG